eukprot:4119410-Alexandrium_andersonii.AAC.1
MPSGDVLKWWHPSQRHEDNNPCAELSVSVPTCSSGPSHHALQWPLSSLTLSSTRRSAKP